MNGIKKILYEYYEIEPFTISQQQGGWAALAYKIVAENECFFLKVYEKSRRSTAKWTALINQYMPILNWLAQNSGLQGRIPELLFTKQGAFTCEDDHAIYLLYRYIDGTTVGKSTLSEEQVEELAVILAELHSYGEEIPVPTDAIREDFSIPFLPHLSYIWGEGWNTLPTSIRSTISPYLVHLKQLSNTVESLAQELRGNDLRMVLCHTDLHNWNLIDSCGRLYLIDWEGLRLSPIEADFMSLVDRSDYSKIVKIYEQTHINFSIQRNALKFYQGRRKLEDIWEFIEQLVYDQQTEEQKVKTLILLSEELEEMDHCLDD
ncbi:aminoglycoside phosphotransferase family protein [Paenibacillus sp. Marseille-Q4541]|uniref:aminoglycoside phosphotransferase family protein n=1 Tax=Paenibacillus sp. Marseille-Q4541 TaxID=2831522 RepID=UPI001BA52A80|nr:aminoglycoside phosphotransferase family protein [Paenibacillus sp. Marseille-Q4541]